jgi:hypothetical protein
MNSAERCLTISSDTNYEATARDEDLLLAARSGSHAAFAELQKIYSPCVFKRILSICKRAMTRLLHTTIVCSCRLTFARNP